jgi:hypothetical protein
MLDPRNRLRRAAATVGAVSLAALALGTSSALAETTHVLERTITLPSGYSAPQPSAVDKDGNIIVWLDGEQEIAKFDANGNPVNFSGLGTNILDGHGGTNCPSVPSDCDRVPTTNGFEGNRTTSGWYWGENNNIVAVDHSGGPADGYIYVENNYGYENPAKHHLEGSEVDVFNEAGKFVGFLERGAVAPSVAAIPAKPGDDNCGNCQMQGISVTPNGTLYTVVGEYSSHVDAFRPIDGNPAHDQFIGQFNAKPDPSTEGFQDVNLYKNGAASEKYVYIGGRWGFKSDEGFWFKYPIGELQDHSLNGSDPIDFSHGTGKLFSMEMAVFENGGFIPSYNDFLKNIAIDPKTENVFIWGDGPLIQEWRESGGDFENKQIGPGFGGGQIGGATTMAIDRSGGPHEGEIYMQGPSGNNISVFSPPVIIPDITPEPNDIGHKSAVLHVEIGTAGGPPVTECRLQWGPSAGYGNFTPCSPSTPYGSDTKVSIALSGLHVERNYHYRFLVKNANGQNYTKDAVLHTQAVLDLSTDPASNFTRTGADLNASFDPDGMATQYYFDWGATQNYTDRTQLMEVPASSGSRQVPPATLTSLQPGHSYHYRVVATNTLGTTLGPDQVFTVPARPRVSGVDATNLTSSTAELDARLNGFAADTTYHWEYGVTPSYGSATPEVDIGSSEADQDIADSIEGLEPGVLYHFRLVAQNQWGTTRTSDASFSFFPPNCPNSHVRQATGGNYLPDCRGYELVSPEHAGGAALFPGDIYKKVEELEGISFPASYFSPPPNALGLATNPPRFGFFAGIGAIPGLHPPNAFIDRYVSTRTTSGWVTTYPGTPGDKTINLGRQTCSISMDLCLDYKTPEAFFGGQGESRAPSLYDVDGNYLGRLPTNLALVPDGEQKIADAIPSPDFSHYVFVSRTPFAQGGLDHSPGSVYDNDIESSSVQVASVLPGGAPIPSEPGTDPNVLHIGGTSLDGSHILMGAPTTPECGGGGSFEHCPDPFSFPAHLYMRVNDATTYDVSKGAPVTLLGMTRNGETVDFLTPLELLPQDTDSSADIYQWNEHTDSLTLLTQGGGVGDTDSCNASWTSACDVQMLHTQRPDLDNAIAPGNGDVYFYSPEQLDPENPGVRNERNLYVYRNGRVQYVTTLDSGTQVDRMQISPDDSHAAFMTTSQMTGYDNEGWEEMYTYDLETGIIDCASCLPSGEPPTIGHLTPAIGSSTVVKDAAASDSGPFMTDDGRVAFSTSDALVPRDTNRAIDVYEFVGDRAQLITSGSETRARVPGALFFPGQLTGFEGFSTAGTDLFFSTYDTLVPQDHNGTFVKFYDARSGGGFGAQPASLPCPSADECHGDGSSAPPPLGIGSQAALGGGSGAPPSQPRKPKHRRKRHPRHPRSPHRGAHGHGRGTK